MEIYLKAEYEHSVYSFEKADIDTLKAYLTPMKKKLKDLRRWPCFT